MVKWLWVTGVMAFSSNITTPSDFQQRLMIRGCVMLLKVVFLYGLDYSSLQGDLAQQWESSL